MKTLNEQIESYTQQLRRGEIQIAYKGILAFMGKLRAAFIKKYPHYDVSNIYPGYLDMSYFSLSTKSLKDQGLKIAIVYLHEKGSFEGWLSARNRDIARNYKLVLNNLSDEINIFHDQDNQDAIMECILIDTPDFEDQAQLINVIDQRVEKFVAAIINH
ncbi:DUF7000 family protein [Acetobacterium woodii]|uniref:DUF7000 domain-containing protein n=1 Tax=Acetobacterium woodii (strain ATCC 29683 / DSM 1030 / JCM 2381 / KCTC 1655 / WB1) TaxID=931626 RepID=H6LBJ5_ACEWD|nr:hypothetical protein [Acetobacterium woodii]AFA50118.1 hypothetical protein Awo_c33900 [Acetobacterium woodii DSM 1030]